MSLFCWILRLSTFICFCSHLQMQYGFMVLILSSFLLFLIVARENETEAHSLSFVIHYV
ncbi:unnamed protein product [Linum tenue]|uniref:Uncharacterized protein n=1 Tax=Linum tenue TaxID=586396 RepID=A0AAV0JGY5_9ROSI|nr:unnamed protein product [Linum tenue]